MVGKVGSASPASQMGGPGGSGDTGQQVKQWRLKDFIFKETRVESEDSASQRIVNTILFWGAYYLPGAGYVVPSLGLGFSSRKPRGTGKASYNSVHTQSSHFN